MHGWSLINVRNIDPTKNAMQKQLSIDHTGRKQIAQMCPELDCDE